MSSCWPEHNMQPPSDCKTVGWTCPQQTTISEGDDNLLHCNRILSETATGDAYLTHSNPETNRLSSVDILAYKTKEKKNLTGNKKNAFFTPLHKSVKNEKNMTNYFAQTLHEFTLRSSCISLCRATFCKKKVSAACGGKLPTLQC